MSEPVVITEKEYNKGRASFDTVSGIEWVVAPKDEESVNPVKPDMRVKMYERYFVGDSNQLSLPQKKRIAALEGLTPGHVKAVYQKIMMMDELNNHDAIIDALEKEVQYMMKNKNSKTGFAI